MCVWLRLKTRPSAWKPEESEFILQSRHTLPNMPFLTAVHIKNYKSVRDAKLRLHPKVTVLVGRNNSGKSNVIDALSFLHTAATGNYSGGLSLRGGFRSLVFGGDQSLVVHIALELQLGTAEHANLVKTIGNVVPGLPTSMLENANLGRTYRYALDASQDGFEERLEFVSGDTSHTVLAGAFSGGNYTLRQFDLATGFRNLAMGGRFSSKEGSENTWGAGSYGPGFGGGISPQDRVAGMLLPIIQNLLRNLIVRVGPNRNPLSRTSITGATSLTDDGSNLTDWLDYLRSNESGRFAQVVREFKTLVPEVEDLTTPRLGGPQTTASIRETWLPEAPGFELGVMSFGVRNLLTIVGHLLDRRQGYVLAVEEPENSIHPRTQRILAKTLWRHAENRQILISTHSPSLVSSYPLESMNLVTREDGASSIVPVDDSNVRRVVDELGIRPSDVLESDALVFVEGESDEKVFKAWYDTLRTCVGNEDMARIHCLFLGVWGLSNIPFYLDSKILKSRLLQPGIFHIVDGDVHETPEKEQQWKRTRALLPCPDDHIYELRDGTMLEDYLLVATAIAEAFPDRLSPVETVESILSDNRRKGLKAKTSLTSLLESFGIRYSPAVAERIALSMQAKDISEDIRNLLKALVFRIQQMSNSSDESG